MWFERKKKRVHLHLCHLYLLLFLRAICFSNSFSLTLCSFSICSLNVSISFSLCSHCVLLSCSTVSISSNHSLSFCLISFCFSSVSLFITASISASFAFCHCSFSSSLAFSSSFLSFSTSSNLFAVSPIFVSHSRLTASNFSAHTLFLFLLSHSILLAVSLYFASLLTVLSPVHLDLCFLVFCCAIVFFISPIVLSNGETTVFAVADKPKCVGLLNGSSGSFSVFLLTSSSFHFFLYFSTLVVSHLISS